MAHNLGTGNCTSMDMMNGVRLSGVQAGVSKEVIHTYLTERGLKIKEILHPLHNNDFVVFFKDSRDAVRAVCERLCDKQLNFTVHPLPHRVFSKVSVDLEEKVSALFLSSPDWQKKVDKVTKGRLKITHDDGNVTMSGDMYDIELAQNVLSLSFEQQLRIDKEVINGHDQDLADALEMSKKGSARKVTGIRGKTSTAEQISASSQGGDNFRHSPREDFHELPQSNGFDITTGSGFSYSRMSSVDDYQVGRNSRETDASKTFNHFTSLPSRTSTAGRDSPTEPDMLEARKSLAAAGFSLEVKGAVGGSSYTQSMTEGERAHLLSRDKNEPSSFSSTFLDDASMLRELDNAPKEELAEIKKWVDNTRSLRDTREEVGGYGDGDETYPMSYDSKQRKQQELDASNSSTSRGLDNGHTMRSSKKSDPFITDVTKYSFDLPGGVKVMVYYGNIVKVKTEGIVNAANSELKNYAGVAGAIERACGSKMRRECENYVFRNGPLNIGDVMHTSAGTLTGTICILHTVGPVYVSSLDDHCAELLTKTFLKCLKYAGKRLRLQSVAFPFVSTGVYGAPLDMCIESFLDAVVWFSHNQTSQTLTEIHLVNTDLEMVQTAIVMIRQHLEQGLDVLVAKARLRLQEKGSQTVFDERSPRADRREPKAAKRTSSLTRFPRSSEEEGRKILTDYRNSDTGSLRQEDVLHREVTDTTSYNTPHRQRAGSFNSSGGRSSVRDRPSSAGGTVGSGIERKTASSSKNDFSKTTPDFKYGFGKQLDTKEKFKTRAATTTGLNSPRNRSVPMKATNNVSITDSSSQNMEHHTFHIRQLHDEEGHYSLPADMNRKARTLPIPTTISDQETCAICMDTIIHPYTLEKCGHIFCKECITKAFMSKPVCPVCGKLYGALSGDQPKGGQMTHTIYTDTSIPGYRDARGVIAIDYSFPSGIQEAHHPNPGKKYLGINRTAYLPNNKEGREVLRLLEKAFKARVTFTIGESRTTGQKNVITWNDIHHKTSITGGSTNFGYPDEGYLKRVKEELAAKGITA